MMKTHDLHGMKVLEAEELFFTILNEVRLKGGLREINFITGTGAIQIRLKALAAENDLNFYVPMANRGCIVVEFE